MARTIGLCLVARRSPLEPTHSRWGPPNYNNNPTSAFSPGAMSSPFTVGMPIPNTAPTNPRQSKNDRMATVQRSEIRQNSLPVTGPRCVSPNAFPHHGSILRDTASLLARTHAEDHQQNHLANPESGCPQHTVSQNAFSTGAKLAQKNRLGNTSEKIGCTRESSSVRSVTRDTA